MWLFMILTSDVGIDFFLGGGSGSSMWFISLRGNVEFPLGRFYCKTRF